MASELLVECRYERPEGRATAAECQGNTAPPRFLLKFLRPHEPFSTESQPINFSSAYIQYLQPKISFDHSETFCIVHVKMIFTTEKFSLLTSICLNTVRVRLAIAFEGEWLVAVGGWLVDRQQSPALITHSDNKPIIHGSHLSTSGLIFTQ